MKFTTHTTLALISFALLACDSPEPAPSAPKETASQSTSKAAEPSTAVRPAVANPAKKRSEAIIGTWRYKSIELPGVPEASKKQIMAEMNKSKLKFDSGKFTSLTNGKVFSSEKYEVVSEKGNQLTIKLTKANKQETYTFPDDDTLEMKDKELGKIVLVRD